MLYAYSGGGGESGVKVETTKPADFIFVIDTTGSMDSYIQSVKNNLTSFVEYLKEKGVDLRISIIEYKDIIEDGKESTQMHLFYKGNYSTDVNEIIEDIDDISVYGGGDDPETPTDAFNTLIENWKIREDAQHFAFLLTDADYKDNNDDKSIEHTMDQIASLLMQNRIHTTVVSNSEFEDRYNSLYTMTNGKFIDINTPDYYKLMIEIAEWMTEIMLDTDGDGLPDEWEINGADVNNDGIIDVPLNEMGADPNVPDIFVEIDWMYKPEKKSHFLFFEWVEEEDEERNLKPRVDALRIVYEQFKNHGINLHIDAGSDSVDFVTEKKWGELSGGNSINYEDNFELGEYFENWSNMAMSNFNKNRWNTFRYCVFMNKFNGTTNSGVAFSPGQFFIVADNDKWISGSAVSQAGTFMHELGHTLGLSHGGIVENGLKDEILFKPNYLSVMNYSYQTTGLLGMFGIDSINYGEYTLATIDENDISEKVGLAPFGTTIDPRLGAKWYNDKGDTFYEYNIAKKSIDFNKNGIIEDSIQLDINAEERNAENKKGEILLSTKNDWDYIKYVGGLIGKGIDESTTLQIVEDDAVIVDELTYDEAKARDILANPGTVIVQNINPKFIYIGSGQKITIDVANLHGSNTTAKINVTSEILKSDFSENILFEANEEKKLEIDLSDDIKKGNYTVKVITECENGIVNEEAYDIEIKEMPVLELTTGEAYKLNSNMYEGTVTWKSQNEKIAKIENDNIVPIEAGEVIVEGITEESELLPILVKIIDNHDSDFSEAANTDEKSSKTTDNFVEKNNGTVQSNTQNKTRAAAQPAQVAKAAPVVTSAATASKTGDTNLTALWITLSVVSAGIVTAMVAAIKKRRAE